MRAREFIVNIPLKIKIDDHGEISVESEKSQIQPLSVNDVMVPPLQQDLEMKKAMVGKNSEVIQNLLQDDNK